jgi:hypothetical protein
LWDDSAKREAMVTFTDFISIINADNSVRAVPLNPDGTFYDTVQDPLELSNNSINLEGGDGEDFQDSVSEMADLGASLG